MCNSRHKWQGVQIGFNVKLYKNGPKAELLKGPFIIIMSIIVIIIILFFQLTCKILWFFGSIIISIKSEYIQCRIQYCLRNQETDLQMLRLLHCPLRVSIALYVPYTEDNVERILNTLGFISVIENITLMDLHKGAVTKAFCFNKTAPHSVQERDVKSQFQYG